MPLEQNQQVERGAEREQDGHRLRGLHHREQRRREHEREAEAGGRLHGGPDESRQRGQDHQATVTRSFGKPGEDVGLAVGHDHEVLDPDADVAGHVDARLDGHDVARRELALRRLGEPRRLVDLEPDAVAEPVAEVLAVAGRVDDLARDGVDVLARRARPAWPRAPPSWARSTSS